MKLRHLLPLLLAGTLLAQISVPPPGDPWWRSKTGKSFIKNNPQCKWCKESAKKPKIKRANKS